MTMSSGATKIVDRNLGEPKRPYHVALKYKIAPEDRDVYRSVTTPSDFFDLNDSEEKAVGSEASYGQYLTPAGAAMFERADNVAYVEAATPLLAPPTVVDIDPEATSHYASELTKYGVQKKALEMHGFFDFKYAPFKDKFAPLMVCDTGNMDFAYLRGRVDTLDFIRDGKRGWTNNGHGAWCLGAAIPQGGRAFSAKVLGEDGRGSSLNIVASWNWMRNYCVQHGVWGVISASIGGPDSIIRSYTDAANNLAAANVLLVCSSGNDGRRNGIDAPANTPSASVVSVGSIDERLVASDFANRSSGFEVPNLWAWGERPVGLTGPMQGTSMAAPFVGRAATLLFSIKDIERIGFMRARNILLRHSLETKILDVESLMDNAMRKISKAR